MFQQPIRVASCILLSMATVAFAAEKPNIVFIVADDMGYADCGVQGCQDIPTPHLDALARAGIRFTDGYATGAVCSPSRAALMTGRHQLRDGVPDWVRPGGRGLNTGVPTVAEYLRKAGYRTVLVGKWHLGEQDPCHPLNRGFDEFFGFLGGGRDYWPDPPNARLDRYRQIVRGRQPVALTEYTTHAFGREAVKFLERQHGRQPFFLYLAFNAVHQPMQALPEDLQRFAGIQDQGRRAYAGMLSAMDNEIGKVLKAIDDAGIEENTLICFLSDNGGPIERNAPNHSQNTPLRGGKGETWEGGIRVPIFMKWTGHLAAGTTFNKPVTQMDLTATALALAGAGVDPKWPIDGVNLMPFLASDEKTPHRSLCWEYGAQWAIRQGPWKLTYALDAKDAKAPTRGLYDLSRDVGETHDLSASHPEQVKQLTAGWAAWRSSIGGDKSSTTMSTRGGNGVGSHLVARFKSFPVEADEHFFTVCRSTERNARRANLVSAAEQWRWSSLWHRTHDSLDMPLAPWPLPPGQEWLQYGPPFTVGWAVKENLNQAHSWAFSHWLQPSSRQRIGRECP